jgi:5-formyltetrahydrofolate cyclo-ligase
MMKKTEARKTFSAQRFALKPFEVNTKQDLLLIRFQQLSLPDFNLVHAYLPLYERNEPDPTPLLDFMHFRHPGMQVTYARINPDNFSMLHFLQDDDMFFEKNQYGIPEPIGGIEVKETDIDIVFIPLLAFDEAGNRVGYGKGYYDRFLSKCRKDVLKIGLSFFPPVDSIEDVDFFDKKMDFCITPERVYAF